MPAPVLPHLFSIGLLGHMDPQPAHTAHCFKPWGPNCCIHDRTQVCSLELIEHGASELTFQTMECIHVFCDVCPTSLAAYFLSLQPLLKPSNSTHNVGIGVKTLNCLFPLTSCVNTWYPCINTWNCNIQLYNIDGFLSLLVVLASSALVDYFVAS